MAIPDEFEAYAVGLNSPYESGVAVTPDDNADLDFITRSLWVGVSGDVAVQWRDGSSVVLKSAPVGLLNVRVARILATGTTASELVALK